MEEVEYNLKATRKVEFEFYFEDQKAIACSGFPFNLFMIDIAKSYTGEDSFCYETDWFERDDKYSEEETYTNTDGDYGVVKLRVTKSWGA